MALARKGSRRIRVDEVDYRWMIRRKPTYSTWAYPDSPLCVALELAAGGGQVALIATGLTHPASLLASSIRGVTPADVAALVRGALAQGWRPEQPGPTFEARVALPEERPQRRRSTGALRREPPVKP